jgi:hypothetical protein
MGVTTAPNHNELYAASRSMTPNRYLGGNAGYNRNDDTAIPADNGDPRTPSSTGLIRLTLKNPMAELVLVDDVCQAFGKTWLRLRWPGRRGDFAGYLPVTNDDNDGDDDDASMRRSSGDDQEDDGTCVSGPRRTTPVCAIAESSSPSKHSRGAAG